MKKIIDSLKGEAKEFFKDTLSDLKENVKTKAKEDAFRLVKKGMDRISDSIENRIFRVKENIPTQIEPLNNEIVTHDEFDIIVEEPIDELLPKEPNDNEKKYIRILKKKIVNGKISESSRYFLKLEGQNLEISENRAEELEELLLQELN